jgi:hypothetical protein
VLAAAVHAGAWFLAYLPQCGAEGIGVGATDISCTGGGAALAWTSFFLIVGFVGAPVGLALLLRRSSQARPWLLASLAEVMLPLLAYLVHGDALLREAITQFVAVPMAVILFATLFGRKDEPRSTDRPSSPQLA